MSRKALLFLFGYSVSFMLFAVFVLFFAFTPKNYDELKRFARVSGMSDAAFYSDTRALRFFSLSKAQDLWDDPFLPPRSTADFVYRMKR